jgi:hypothetical protein
MRHLYTAALLLITLSAAAQNEEKFKVRLTPVPMDAAMRASVAGSGAATATLMGSRLTIAGSFDGLPSAATIAQIHRGVATGVRGSSFLDLTVTKAVKGTLAGSFELTADQIDSLRKGKLYIQIHSEKAPEGGQTLWGWILK